MIKLVIAFFLTFSALASNNYKRSDFGYIPYFNNSKKGFYTEQLCKTNIDHVVSLKDAFESGANTWDFEKKKKFSNDKSNHVPACYRVNSSKGSATPKDFLRRSSDKRGLDYKITSFCKYLEIYFRVKMKYNLSFKNNDSNLFLKCNLNIKNIEN
ncbi:hypothetical protein OA264_00975 [Alphaproteobacteria bacterium]|nr:hypothetical protein [Alphaproteobacteria bacterium]